MDRFADLDLTRRSRPNDQRLPTPLDSKLAEIMKRMGKFTPERRAELRRLRLRHLPGARPGHLQGLRRKRDVPALHHRPAPQHGPGS